MSNGQRLEIEQRTVQRLSQQQVRYVRLLELNAPEFDEAVEREMEDNPALADAEEEQPLEIQQLNGWMPRTRSDEAEDYSNITPDSSMSLYDHLNDQLAERDMPDNVGKAARFIIGSLDSNGYLTRTIRDIVDDMAFGPGIYITEREAGHRRGRPAADSGDTAGGDAHVAGARRRPAHSARGIRGFHAEAQEPYRVAARNP